jgi:hypothetical protein
VETWGKCRFVEPYCLRLISIEEVMRGLSAVMGSLVREKNVAVAIS